MFKHLLVATDGSPLANKGLALALKLAATCGDKTHVTAMMVTPDYGTMEFAEVTLRSGPSVQELRKSLAAEAKRQLDAVLKEHRAGERVESSVAVSDFPYDEIVRAAERLHCDLIVMAARGRGPMKSALLGSQTAHVLSLAKVPVLVVK